MKKLCISQYFFSIWPITLLGSLLLFGCSERYRPMEDESSELPHKVARAVDKIQVKLEHKLKSSGVRVITIGQDYLISIPSAALFPEQSPQLMWGSYPLLNTVVKYLKQFRKVGLSVTSYSSRCVSTKREHALTLARARAVANYLWSQCVESRFIFTDGVGSDKPISVCPDNHDKSINSRIEITFRNAII